MFFLVLPSFRQGCWRVCYIPFLSFSFLSLFIFSIEHLNLTGPRCISFLKQKIFRWIIDKYETKPIHISLSHLISLNLKNSCLHLFNLEKKLKKQQEPQARKRLVAELNSIWTEYQRRTSRGPTTARLLPLNHKRPWIHAVLTKAESSLATQIHAEKIGMAPVDGTKKR